jgi:hypothetical protein
MVNLLRLIRIEFVLELTLMIPQKGVKASGTGRHPQETKWSPFVTNGHISNFVIPAKKRA